MKVVLFCGGLGMRLREYAENVPKPMVTIGSRPLLWYLMKYYSYYGHHDFILCLGYRADVIKNYFLNYNEAIANDFVWSARGTRLEVLRSDVEDWRITFVDTGMSTSIGQRLKAVEEHLEGEEVFLANYTDNLTDLPLPRLLEFSQKRDKTAAFLCVRPRQTFHVVSLNGDGTVRRFLDAGHSNVWTNGGFFVFKRRIFDYIRPGEDLVAEPFQRLIQEKELLAYRYDGFWACMDTFKEKQQLEDLYAQGSAPWRVWETHEARAVGADA